MSDLRQRLQRLLAPQTPDSELDEYENLIAKKYRKVSLLRTHLNKVRFLHNRMLIHTCRHTMLSIATRTEPSADRN